MPFNPPSPNKPRHITCIVGARPNFMKIAPIMAALRAVKPKVELSLVHTGQHYDAAMNHQYFDALGIPQPDVNLEVRSGSHAEQTANVMLRFEPVLDATPTSAVLVVGDVNSTLACALVAAKKGVPVIHVEAGLRSLDRSMPEEINRVMTDQISDLLFTTERKGRENLLREGIDDARIHFTGNVMIDTLRAQEAKAVPVSSILENAGVQRLLEGGKDYAVLTLHRPSNVDHADTLRNLLETVAELSHRLPVIFPVHPRTKQMMENFGLRKLLDLPTIALLPPMGYLEMLGLLQEASVVLTDSGGLQEESTALGIPCLTLRNNTERLVTVTEGTNTIVGTRPADILAAFDEVMQSGGKRGRIPEFWDGQASVRIADVIQQWLTREAAPQR